MNNDKGNNDVENIIPLKLEIEETPKNIFEYAVFKLFPDKNFTLFSLMNVYDSIIWKVSNIDGRMKVLEQTDHSLSLIHIFSGTISLPTFAEYAPNKILAEVKTSSY